MRGSLLTSHSIRPTRSPLKMATGMLTLPAVADGASSHTPLASQECDLRVCTQSEVSYECQHIVSLNGIKAVNVCQSTANRRHMLRRETGVRSFLKFAQQGTMLNVARSLGHNRRENLRQRVNND